jgi:hypothetical protein
MDQLVGLRDPKECGEARFESLLIEILDGRDGIPITPILVITT